MKTTGQPRMHIQTTLPPSIASRVVAIAARDHCSMASVIRRLVAHGLETRQAQTQGTVDGK